jgi:hypothetical protein
MDPELFKTLLQGGSFGLLAVAVVWLLFTGAPMIRDANTRMTADLKATVDALVAAFRAELKEQREWLTEELDKRDAALDRMSQAIAQISDRVNNARPPAH